MRKPRTDIKLPFVSSKNIFDSSANLLKGDLYEVLPKSSMQLKKALEKIAYFFKREFSYDFVQFEAADDSDYIGIAFGEHCMDFSKGGVRIYGGCCFRFRDNWKSLPPGWFMQWIWLHPYYRHSGILSENWNQLKKRIGDFYCEPPFSGRMKSFLKEKGEWEKYEEWKNKDK